MRPSTSPQEQRLRSGCIRLRRKNSGSAQDAMEKGVYQTNKNPVNNLTGSFFTGDITRQMDSLDREHYLFFQQAAGM